MTDLPFDITHIDADEVQALEATYLLLRAKFKVAMRRQYFYYREF